jgi:hypothetical protein
MDQPITATDLIAGLRQAEPNGTYLVEVPGGKWTITVANRLITSMTAEGGQLFRISQFSGQTATSGVGSRNT